VSSPAEEEQRWPVAEEQRSLAEEEPRRGYPSGMIRRSFAVAAAAVLVAGCARTTNLLDPALPRFSGSYALQGQDARVTGPIRIVTFNIKLARRIDSAVAVLESDSLAGADVIALEEMDNVGTDRIARALHMNYVYYPGSIHPTEHKFFGNAVLSRWPIARTSKILLPHESRTRHQRRAATSADVVVRGDTIRVYGVHLETPSGGGDRVREDQVDTILADAASFRGPIVIAGDFNSYGIGVFLTRHGYRWLTEHIGSTISMFTWDHIFVRGMASAGPGHTGVVRENHGASDHRPVWAVVVPVPAASGNGLSRVAATR
jgi:endonuclease/exonuclease/phosphatase family metal-dependent hydrolase